MTQIIDDALESLTILSESILALEDNDDFLNVTYGWNFPALSFIDLAEVIKSLTIRISNLEIDTLSGVEIYTLETLPARVERIIDETVSQLISNEDPGAFQAIYVYVVWLENTLFRGITAAELKNPDVVTFELAKRFRALTVRFDELEVSRDGLGDKIDVIENAYEAARSLPVDRQTLAETRDKIEAYATSSAKNSALADEHLEKLASHLKNIGDQSKKADSVVKRAEEAYRIATTTGLAGAFEDRAKKLTLSTWIWTAGLVLSLAAGIFIGSDRLQSLSTSLEKDPSNTIVMIQFVLSIIGLGAPIWFAWISTKQIGQRFRLSEDYAFKASVAKAYEGYRKEATRLDEKFEARLFGSTLDRIEEEPLRLVESGIHSSPIAELIASKRFNKHLENDYDLRQKLLNMIQSKNNKSGNNSTNEQAPSKTQEIKEVEDD